MSKKDSPLLAALAVLASCCATAAQAQSVQIYGILDVAVERVSNVNPAGGALYRMPNLSGGWFPSRLGFRGSEDLGGGLKALFTLEQGLQPDTGALGQGGRAFGRQAWVGLSGPWGTVSAGRTYSMLFMSFFDVDVIGPSQISLSNFDGYLPNARHDNSVSYRGTFDGLTLGATYSLGRDASNAGGPAATNCPGENAADSKACREWSAMVRYDMPTWGALVAYDTFNGGAGAAAPFSPTTSAQSDSRVHAAGYAKFGPVKVAGGWLHRRNEASSTPKSDLAYVGVSYDVTPLLSIDGQVSKLDIKNSSNGGTLLALRATYNLSKRTAVYGMLGAIDNRGQLAAAVSAGATIPAGGSQNAVLAGIKHSF